MQVRGFVHLGREESAMLRRATATVLAALSTAAVTACGNTSTAASQLPKYQKPLACPVPGLKTAAEPVGPLPSDFAPVQIWRCTYRLRLLPTKPAAPTHSPSAGPDGLPWVWRTVDRAEGDSTAIVAALRASPEPGKPGQSHVCPSDAVAPTTLVVVDRTGRAVAPDLPTEPVCGRLSARLKTAIDSIHWKATRANSKPPSS
jgi:hypothetical protein